MRIANLSGRAALITPEGAVDIERASGGRFGPDPMSVYTDWAEFQDWARAAALPAAVEWSSSELEAAVPRPPQVFAIGLNYSDHAKESNLPEPSDLVVFTKFASCLTGPDADVRLTSETVDYETELVAVIAREAKNVSEDDAWDHVAGICVGQDISDRGVQWSGPAPQFSLGKSFPDFGPIGPVVVSLDDIDDPAALSINASIISADGTSRVVQAGSTADLIFSIPQIVSRLSAVVTLLPGDIVFTGTPAGVGAASGRYLTEGDVLISEIAGLGKLQNRFHR